MPIADLFLAQLTEPFRIVFLLALFYTMLRTQANSGTWVPLAVGAAFVAVVIPVSHVAGPPKAPLITEIALGLVSNGVWLAVMLGVWTLWQRSRR